MDEGNGEAVAEGESQAVEMANAEGGEMLERFTEASIVQVMRTAYLDYSMSVIVSRALPDVRDGLKPVQRRIL
ncbi:MAG: hypothetical protein LBH53_00860, partial [Puniceicoccales bacterium]|nr:hypothetical protein [Puniceicoccales bacterium]